MSTSASTHRLETTRINPSNPNNKFGRFTELPRELQYKIWRLTYPAGQDININDFIIATLAHTSDTKFCMGAQQVSLRVHSASRAEVKKDCFVFSIRWVVEAPKPRSGRSWWQLGIDRGPRNSIPLGSLHINTKLDNLLFDLSKFFCLWSSFTGDEPNLWKEENLLTEKPGFLPSVQRLEFINTILCDGWPLRGAVATNGSPVARLLLGMTNLKTLTFTEYEIDMDDEPYFEVYKSRKWWEDHITEFYVRNNEQFSGRVPDIAFRRHGEGAVWELLPLTEPENAIGYQPWRKFWQRDKPGQKSANDEKSGRFGYRLPKLLAETANGA